jgi:ribonuclease T2
MRRGDITVLSISAVLAAIVVVAVTYSVRVLDRTPVTVEFEPVDSPSTWLVMTWAPSLCIAASSSPGCASGHVEGMGQTWILHGLWPQPATNQYCGVPKGLMDRARDIRNTDLPPVDIGGDTRESLQSMMSDASVLAPHEWYAHGTCSGVTPDVYFGDAVALTEQARTVLNPIFVANAGGRIQLRDVQEELDREFGAGAGDRIRLSCRNVTGLGSVAYELHLSLPPVTELRTPAGTRSLHDLIGKAPTLGPGCQHASLP